MKNLTRIIVTLVAVGGFLVIAAFAYIYVSGGSGEASEEISAPTLQAGEDLLFRIVPEESEIRFRLNEDLRGQPNEVVGITNQVAGDILIDLTTPANTTVGTIRVNVRTLATDSEFRDRAIRSQILESQKDEYEFSEFVPTAVEGLPDSVEIGQPFTFTIVGDLTVRDITKPVTFETTVTPVSEDRLEGVAKAQVLRGDFDLQIPSVPGVANVTDEVSLEIDFVAAKVTNATPQP